MSNPDRDLLLPVVPQQFGEALQMWGEGTINCTRDEWDNRTTAENAVWLLLRLEEERDELARLVSDAPRTNTLLPPEFQRLWESCRALCDKAQFQFVFRYLGRVERKLAAALAERDALMDLIVRPWTREGDGKSMWKIYLAWWDSDDTREGAVARVRAAAKLDPKPVQP